MTVVEGRYADKVALVTGAASGIGRATATRLVAEGALVVGGDVNAQGLEDLGAHLGERFRGAAVGGVVGDGSRRGHSRPAVGLVRHVGHASSAGLCTQVQHHR